jgi:hypothetical protein
MLPSKILEFDVTWYRDSVINFHLLSNYGPSQFNVH